MKQEITELTRVLGQVVNRLDRLAEILTEKGEKENPPLDPPKGKDPKRNPPAARACACEEDGFDRLFDEFWAKYPKECPRKVRRKKCRAKYASLMRKAKDPAALHAAILAGIERWRRSQDWVEDEGKFIMAPLVWLNQESWDDNPAPYTPRLAATPLERAAEERERMRRLTSAATHVSAVAALTAEDWELCREDGCRHCLGNGCACGVKLPPDHRLNARPCRPVECPRFSAKGLPSVARSAKESSFANHLRHGYGGQEATEDRGGAA